MKLEIKKLIQFLKIQNPFEGFVKQEIFKEWFMKTNKFTSVNTPELLAAAIEAGIKVEIKKGQKIAKLKNIESKNVKDINSMSKAEIEAIVKGSSLNKIALEYGCSYNKLKRKIDALGIKYKAYTAYKNKYEMPTKEELIKNYALLMTVKNLSKFYGISHDTANRWLKKYEIKKAIIRNIVFEQMKGELNCK